ncbi:MAG: NADP-dependent malic enzyme [Rhodobiaceae bacterium]|jgi:malate dehydrogenase (oxaloacetate-decarboxylating)(NADP+)|nr:NADP-dependent malic enzyme [Rhodobiaceae bacterium]MBT7279657.1 NADP-dependent malic enzyme [Rhodobiaceae bacterium]
MTDTDKTFTDAEALRFHSRGKPGKLEITPTKPMATQRDLSLAYSPGVAVPVQAIADNPDASYDYTSRGNMVAVISNGTAILGLGNLGALASKPVMEGKAVLFKRFADVDSIDLEIDTEDPTAFVDAVKHLGPSFGGINLEDIKAPDCFIIEQQLRELMDIPVFHDDQHGTAIICAAGLINALHLTGRDIKDIKICVNGAGSAGIACLELIKAMGLPHENAVLCDTKGVIYQGRKEGMNQWKSAHAVNTKARSLEDAMTDADVFLGLSVKGAVTKDMVAAMAPNPIIFAMANPDPEITPEEVAEIRDDAIMATGRSDYPNQVNNVLGFPYIFRGALDVRAKTINDEMKIACAEALAMLAREDVPDEVAAAYQGERPRFGARYIIPVPFDPRLISVIPPAVARAAMDSGVARAPIVDLENYQERLKARLDPAASSLQIIMNKSRQNAKRMIFAEGEQEQVIRAAVAYKDSGLGEPILIGTQEIVRANMAQLGLESRDDIEIRDTRTSDKIEAYTAFLYSRLQRHGKLYNDCLRMVANDRNMFGACAIAQGDGDAMVTGVTRSYSSILEEISQVIEPRANQRVMGISMLIARGGRTVLVSDTNVIDMPSSEELADIATQTAATARALGHEPRVAMLAYSTFGHPEGDRSVYVREAVRLLDERKVDFEYEGEMAADVALNREAMKRYPFNRLSEPANVLIMPAIHSASISTKMLEELGGATLIGPILVGLEHPVQIARIGATSTEVLNMAAIAGYGLEKI